MEEDSHVVCVGNNPHVCPAITWMHTSVSVHSAGADQPLGVCFKPIDGFNALHQGFIRDAGATGHLGVHVASSSTHGGKNQSAGRTKVTPAGDGIRD